MSTTVLPEPVVLSAQPGRITGQVRLVQFETTARLQDVAIQLFGDDDEPIATAEPDTNGYFVFDDVLLGEWRVRASHPAYQRRERIVRASPGAAVSAGQLDLIHQSQGEGAVALVGQVTLSDKADHAGTRVSVLIEPSGLLSASTQ
ncbi:MAG: carboxypeptidase-like regulatory domain-containing protein, partial [Actinomycetota bacterium]|nr:carboxypeptidase-like regulatory domain-containing protein [Actinomycetota bacterium]